MNNTINNHRLPRHRRVPGDVPPLVLTSRDIRVIHWVYELRYLTAGMVQRLEYPEPSQRSWCQERLKRMFQHGYLNRIYKPVSLGLGSVPAVYLLDEKGRDLIAAERGLLKTEVKWERGADLDKALPFLDHSLAIAEVRISFILACQREGCQLEWIDERTLRGQEMRDYVEDSQGEKVSVVPDGYLTIRLPDGRSTSLFLELDRGRQDMRQFRQKMRGHAAYANGGQYEQRYQTRSLRILTVTTAGEKRLEELMRWTEAEEGGDLFWFTTLEGATAEAILTQPVWRVTGQPGLYALLS